jgi:hypothetical protein
MNRLALFAYRGLQMGLTLGLLLAQPAALAQQAAEDRNVFKNPNFESGLDEWKVKKESVAAIDPEEKHGQMPALRIENATPGDAFVTQKVPVTPNTRYRISAFIKTKDVKAVKRGDKSGACISISGGYKHTPPVQETKGWNKVSFEWASGGETEIDIGPRLGMYYGVVTGTAWFSELKMVAIGRAPRQ